MSVDTLWYTRCPVPTAFGIALRLGWLHEEFARDNIAFRSLSQSADRKVRESHFAHTQPRSFRHGGNSPPIWSRSVGNDVRLIGLSWAEEPHALLALPGSGIKTTADLKGRRLSLPIRKNDSIDFWRATALKTYETALATAGLKLEDVKLTPVEIDRSFINEDSAPAGAEAPLWGAFALRSFQREEILALARGEVDVISSEAAWVYDISALLGARIVYDSVTHPDPIVRSNNGLPLALTVSGGLLKERPDLVARLLKRVLEAAEWGRSHPSEVVRFIAAEEGVAEEVLEHAYGANLAQQLAVDLSPRNVAALRDRKSFLLRHGFLKKDFDLDEWIAPEPLEEARRLLRASVPVPATVSQVKNRPAVPQPSCAV